MSLDATKHYLSEAFKVLQVSERLEQMLINPYRIVKTAINIELDDGQVSTYMGYRVQHNKTLGPMKGGLRYHPTVEESEVESLASLMTWKTSLLQLPFGGGKGGIQCDPKDLSEAEVERLTKAFTVKIKEIIGPYKDIPAPDVNTNAQIMAWIMSEYSEHYGFTPAVVTGKPVYLHGSLGREHATGLGVVYTTEFLLKDYNLDVKDCSFVIQGFGNVGYHAAKFIAERQGKVLAVSDATGAIMNDDGLDVEDVKKHINQFGTLEDYPDAEHLTNEELLLIPCDVIIPAALGDVFDADNAKEIQCKFIVEGANAPTKPEADEIFNQRNIIVVPDILANAGGVVVSYFEWVQNLQQLSWDVEHIDQQLHKKMHSAYTRVSQVAQQRNIPLRTAAYYLGLGRVAKAKLTLGI